MAIIKAYTDISQSKTLSKILPLESADMIWANDNDVIVVPYDIVTRENVLHDFIPCWSLSALLSVLPNENILVKTTDSEYYCLANDVMTKPYDNYVDACVAMIEKLYKLNLL